MSRVQIIVDSRRGIDQKRTGRILEVIGVEVVNYYRHLRSGHFLLGVQLVSSKDDKKVYYKVWRPFPLGML